MKNYLKNLLKPRPLIKIASLSLFSYYVSPFFLTDIQYDPKNFIVSDSDYLDLEVKTSKLPKSGQGLFAKKIFKNDEIIGEYRGHIVDSEKSNDPIFDYETKMLTINDKYVMLGRSIVAYANDCVKYDYKKYGTKDYEEWIKKEDFPKIEGCEYNADIKFKGNKAFLVAIKEIKVNDEIYLDYGFNYWKVFYEYYDGEGKVKKL